MKGSVLGFKSDLDQGVISGNDGVRYRFVIDSWQSEVSPSPGLLVDFVPHNQEAHEIFAAQSARGNEKSDRVLVSILAFFLGYLGVHKFYLGYKTQGVIMLVCTMFGWPLLFIPFLAVCTISTVEAIIYITKSDEEFEAIYIQNCRPWF